MKHSTEAVALTGVTLNVHLIKSLHAKGILTEDDYRALLTAAIEDASQHDRAEEVIACIREIARI